jgi:hypothetical protein
MKALIMICSKHKRRMIFNKISEKYYCPICTAVYNDIETTVIASGTPARICKRSIDLKTVGNDLKAIKRRSINRKF